MNHRPLRDSFESSVKEKDHQTLQFIKTNSEKFESSVKEKDHQTIIEHGEVAPRLRAV